MHPKSICFIPIIAVLSTVGFYACHSPTNGPEIVETTNAVTTVQDSSTSDTQKNNADSLNPAPNTADNTKDENMMPAAFMGMPQSHSVTPEIKARILPIVQKALNTEEFYVHEIGKTNWYTINLPAAPRDSNLRDAPPPKAPYYVIDLNHNAIIEKNDWQNAKPLFDVLTQNLAGSANQTQQTIHYMAEAAEIISTGSISHKFGKYDITPTFSESENGWTLTYYTVHNNGMSKPRICTHVLSKSGETLNETVENCYIP